MAGPDSGNVSYLKNDEGAVGFVVQRTGTTSAVTPSGGALAGYAEGAQKIVAARDTLNGIATDFTKQVNDIQAQGRDLDGKPGAPLFETGATPTSITVVLTDPRGIAAASDTGGVRDASNLTALLATRDPTTGSEQRLTNMITSNAASLEQRRLVGDAQGAIRDGAVTARDSGSGVDLDSEAVDLLRFQQAYQASSRVIQTARDILQTILEIR